MDWCVYIMDYDENKKDVKRVIATFETYEHAVLFAYAYNFDPPGCLAHVVYWPDCFRNGI